MKLVLAIGTVVSVFLASSQLLVIALRTYGLNPRVSVGGSLIWMVFFLALATLSLWALVSEHVNAKKSDR